MCPFHCCVIDGMFVVGEDGQVRFAEAALSPEDLAAVQQQARARVMRWCARAAGAHPLPCYRSPNGSFRAFEF